MSTQVSALLSRRLYGRDIYGVGAQLQGRSRGHVAYCARATAVRSDAEIQTIRRDNGCGHPHRIAYESSVFFRENGVAGRHAHTRRSSAVRDRTIRLAAWG